jgi:ribosomal protein S1
LKNTTIDWSQFKIGDTVKGVITKIESYGAIVKLKQNVSGFCPTQHLKVFLFSFFIHQLFSSCFGILFNTKTLFFFFLILKGAKINIGVKTEFRILDVDKLKQVVDLTLLKSLMKKPQKKLSKGQNYDVQVEMVKENYLVLSVIGKGIIGFAPTKDFNTMHSFAPFNVFSFGQTRNALLQTIWKKERMLFVLNPEVDKSLPIESQIKTINDISPGMIVKGRIFSIRKDRLKVNLGFYIRGQVNISEIRDDDDNSPGNPLSNFKVFFFFIVMNIHHFSSSFEK